MTLETEIGEQNSLAYSITQRAMKEMVAPDEPPIMPEYAHKYLNLVTMLFEDPTTAITYGAGVTRIAFEAPYQVSDITPEEAIFREYTVNSFLASYDTTDFLKRADEIIHERDIALELARKKGISVQRIFEDEELYAELMRTTYAPSDYCLDCITRTDKLTSRFPDIMASAMDREARNISAKSISNYISTNESIHVFMLDASVSLENKKKVLESGMPELKRSAADNLLTDFERFWGDEAYFDLPESVKDWIANT